MRLLTTLLISVFLVSCKAENENLRQERFMSAVVNLRQGGLFENYEDLDDEKLTRTLIERAKRKYRVAEYDGFDKIFDPEGDSESFELHVAALDDTRVWWRDLEADILNGNNVYAQTVEEFGKLSGGFLRPAKIKEEWTSDEGPVKVSFWDSDTLRVFILKYYDDWYDTDFFQHMRSSLEDNGSPYQFYRHDRTGQDVFLIRLTEDEKERIEKKMKWRLWKF
jgi:hypothetical protein